MDVKDKSVILYMALFASVPKKFVTAAPNTHMLLYSHSESILVEGQDYLEFFLSKEKIAD